MVRTIAIIGGGAAGMMAAAQLLQAQGDYAIHLFEKNTQLGAKVIISGGGRCNVTTGYYRWKDLAEKYIRGSAFVRDAIGFFGPRKIMQWFESYGVPLKIEQDMRVFPQSDSGKDIVGVFEQMFARYASKIKVHRGSSITNVEKSQTGFLLSLSSGQKLSFTTVLLATGGNAYAHTGSSGDAYEWVKNMGHTITPLGPSLNSFLTTDRWMHGLSGMSFAEARLSVILSSGEKRDAVGPVLLTHFGISGPTTFVISAYSSFERIDRAHPLTISFQPYAQMGFHEREQFLLSAIQEHPRKKIATLLRQFFSDRCIEALDESVFHGSLQEMAGLCTKQFRQALAQFFSGGWSVTVTARRAGDEFVTAGGVSCDEVNPKTGESRLVPGLYFAGEILDVDAVTGGYNLTSSRATGALAARHIASLC